MDVTFLDTNEARAQIQDQLRRTMGEWLLGALRLSTVEAEDFMRMQAKHPLSDQSAWMLDQYLDRVGRSSKQVETVRRQLLCSHEWWEPQAGPAVCPLCGLALFVNDKRVIYVDRCA